MVTPPPSLDDAHRMLRDTWGHQRFRLHQRRAVAAALRGRDCLAVVPTGGGKSLCYQIPALLLPGVTVVVSPLISLMQDQVATLRGRGVLAAYLSSTQAPETRDAVWRATREQRLRLLYVAPERLATLAHRLRGLSVSLVAVDEAHCISEWGHEFRPQYRAIRRHVAALGRPPVMAVTATATPATRADIVRNLGLRRPVTIVRSFDRANLFFAARRCRGQRERLVAVAALLRGLPAGAAILYAPTRNRTDGVAAVLRRWGIPVAPYHAGLSASARRAILAAFRRGRQRFVVATSAFGMGIDRPDVRLVVHLGVPRRPEAYFQEAGRAGRDGGIALCEISWLDEDLTLAARLMRRSREGPQPESGGEAEAAQRGFRAMRRYVTTRSCRRRVLLAYMGERLETCGGCDRCADVTRVVGEVRRAHQRGPACYNDSST